MTLQMDVRADGRTAGRTNGRTDGRMDAGYKNIPVFSSKSANEKLNKTGPCQRDNLAACLHNMTVKLKEGAKIRSLATELGDKRETAQNIFITSRSRNA